MQDHKRCPWCGSDALYVRYHDEVWAVPQYDSKVLFAKLILDGAQAGLSWITILKKQDNYYKLFGGLDPEKIVRFTDQRLEKILLDPGIVRNRLKVYSVRSNARIWAKMYNEGTDFSEFLWSFVGGKPIINRYKEMRDVPSTSAASDAMSKALKRLGFKFVGSTICYAFMQAVGMYNDHLITCPRWKAVQDPALLP